MSLIKVKSRGTDNVSGRRNLIINGAMQIFQRATAATQVDNSYNTVDRFRAYKNGGAYTTEKSTDNPFGTGSSLKAQVTTADTSMAAGEYAFINHEIEAQDLQHLLYGTSSAKNVTLSFWVKSNKTGIYTVGVYKHANGATAYMYRKEYTISSANTWEKKEFTISPTAGSTTFMTSSGGAIANNNGNGFGISFNLALGSNFHGTNDAWAADAKYGTSNQVNWMDNTSNNFYITQIQLEVGDSASDFEHRSFAEELQLCQRYFQRTSSGGQVYFAVGHVWSSTLCQFQHTFPTRMRAHPSISTSGTITNLSMQSPVNVSSTSIDDYSGSGYTKGHVIKFNGNMSSSGYNTGYACALLLNSNGAYIQFDAEI